MLPYHRPAPNSKMGSTPKLMRQHSTGQYKLDRGSMLQPPLLAPQYRRGLVSFTSLSNLWSLKKACQLPLAAATAAAAAEGMGLPTLGRCNGLLLISPRQRNLWESPGLQVTKAGWRQVRTHKPKLAAGTCLRVRLEASHLLQACAALRLRLAWQCYWAGGC